MVPPKNRKHSNTEQTLHEDSRNLGQCQLIESADKPGTLHATTSSCKEKASTHCQVIQSEDKIDKDDHNALNTPVPTIEEDKGIFRTYTPTDSDQSTESTNEHIIQQPPTPPKRLHSIQAVQNERSVAHCESSQEPQTSI